MKHLIPLIFCATATIMCTSTTFSHLDNTRIQQFDDKKIGTMHVGIDGALIHDILWVIDIINGVQHGSPRHNTTRSIKKYNFDGHLMTLQELVELEQLEGTTHKKTDFLAVVEEIKGELGDTVTHFMQQLIIKTVICDAIEEWCKKSDRNHSLLQVWASTNKEEFESVYHKIVTARDLNLFLADLKSFLTDVVESCPRAWDEFLKHKEEYAAQTIKKHNVSP